MGPPYSFRPPQETFAFTVARSNRRTKTNAQRSSKSRPDAWAERAPCPRSRQWMERTRGSSHRAPRPGGDLPLAPRSPAGGLGLPLSGEEPPGSTRNSEGGWINPETAAPSTAHSSAGIVKTFSARNRAVPGQRGSTAVECSRGAEPLGGLLRAVTPWVGRCLLSQVRATRYDSLLKSRGVVTGDEYRPKSIPPLNLTR